MVTTRAMTAGTRPKVHPLPAKPSKAEKAAKAARIKAEKEEKKADKAAAKRLNDAKKAAAKADKDANKAAAKAAKAANAKSSTKGTKGTKQATAPKIKATKATKVTKVTKVTKAIKVAKAAKTTKQAKATKSSVSAATVKASTNQYDEDEDEDGEDDEDDEESEEEHYEPQSKRRKVETLAPPNLYVEIGPTKATRPALQIIGEWDYMRKADVPEGVENEDNRPLPHIYIGGTAPQPRWVITQTESIKVPSKRRAPSTSSKDFGDLHWTFEEGDFKQWTGLEYPALYELAYLCLEYTLVDTEIREQIYKSLAHGPLPKAVTVGDKWYPALPPVPITRHFATGTSEQPSRKTSDTGFYFPNYERPNLAVKKREDYMVQPYPHAASHIYNRPRVEVWPTASRSASPDQESERGSEHGSEESQSADSTKSSVSGGLYLERDPEGPYSEPTATISLGNEQNSKQDNKQDREQDGEGSQSVDSRRSSVTRESDLELNPEGTYSEPTTPVSLGNDEKISRDTISEDGSVFGDGGDVQVEPNSARDSREQSPDSLFSGSGSDSEVSASSKTSEPSKVNAADDNSVQSTNSLSPVSHDGLFSPGQIEGYYGKKEGNFERLGGVEHHETSERKRQTQPSLEDAQEEAEIRELEMVGVTEPCKRMRMESPSPSPPATRRKTASEIRVDKVMSFARAGQEKRDEMRAAAAEKISDKPPLALLKKTTGNQAGARSQADAPSPEIPHNLQDRFLEQTKAYLKDPIQRARHFPDPLAVRRVRVWAGEELVGHEIKPTVDAMLPPWAERHRPFSQWQNTTGITPAPTAGTKVSRSKRRSKGQGKRRPTPASAKEQSVSSARWSSFR